MGLSLYRHYGTDTRLRNRYLLFFQSVAISRLFIGGGAENAGRENDGRENAGHENAGMK